MGTLFEGLELKWERARELLGILLFNTKKPKSGL
jgi:hypothetical protein